MVLIQIFFAILCGTHLVTSIQYEGDECFLRDGVTIGECRIDRNCPSFMKLATNKNDLKTAINTFKRCGFTRDDAIVCCPEVTQIETSIPDIVSPQLETKYQNRISVKKCEEYSISAPPPAGPQILQGIASRLGEFPHMVALGYLSTGGYEYNCGGSLVSENYILTAAHCTTGSVTPTIAKLGSIYTNDTENIYEIESITDHEQYKRKIKYYDISLIKLKTNVEIKAFLRPACLDTSLEDPKLLMVATGWGITSEKNSERSKILMRANFTAVNKETCSKEFGSGVVFSDKDEIPDGIKDSQMCAIGETEKTDTCLGDSGGPLQFPSKYENMWTIAGITSFGRSCGSVLPAVYTRVSSYLDWIEDIVWKDENQTS